ncbi:MAG: ATP-binding protein [bacterium]
MQKDYENIRNLVIGTVEFISPKEIKVLLETNAPQSTSINAGIPQLFPRVNGFVLIPNESGSLIGIITWIAVEYSPYPKRQGYKDFNLVDLPFPLRKLSISPLGVLKGKNDSYEVERGVYSYPSVGDAVVVPNKEQLQAIVQNKDENAGVKIGTSPMAANAPVYVNPDKVFGRHVAILGNTGSGKSCSVAGLVRWSIEAAQIKKKDKGANARFIILDPNGEYGNAFNDLGEVRHYEVILKDDNKQKCNKDNEKDNTKTSQLKVPSWMWNSWEWTSISQASSKTQRPILKRALREIKGTNDFVGNSADNLFKNFLMSFKINILLFQAKGASLSAFPDNKNYYELLEGVKKSFETFTVLKKYYENYINQFVEMIDGILKDMRNEKGYFIKSFSLKDVTCFLKLFKTIETTIGDLIPYNGPDEDTPTYFKNEDFLLHIEQLAQESNSQQYNMDFFLMRVRSLFTEQRIASVINTQSEDDVTLECWLKDYIGSEDNKPSITIIDLSLLPSDIIYLIVAVMARLIFEAHQRYKRFNNETLPTTLVVEEAHNFIKRYEYESDDISSQKLCGQIFEKIAKEGRKFGLGLVISSQRPSELSQTVLSQCNTFLLHRIVNDKDQEMVRKLVPDTMGGILNELSVLPTRKALLLGWAAPIPVLVEMNELKLEHQPKSKDPDFWNVWIGECDRKVEWAEISNDWQKKQENLKD